MSDAYHLRLELLKMAREMLEQNYFAEREQISSDWAIKVQTAERLGETPPTHPGFPEYPHSSAIISKAKELNKFISER
jgi:hypothetical protein